VWTPTPLRRGGQNFRNGCGQNFRNQQGAQDLAAPESKCSDRFGMPKRPQGRVGRSVMKPTAILEPHFQRSRIDLSGEQLATERAYELAETEMARPAGYTSWGRESGPSGTATIFTSTSTKPQPSHQRRAR